MAYMCFVESSILMPPKMQALAAQSEDEARREAEEILARQSDGIAAHVFEGEVRICSVRSAGPR